MNDQPTDQPINILMVDDSATNLLALESILKTPDRNLVRATSGEAALLYLLDHDVAVVLLDVYMPGIDGLETAELIRSREKSRDIPIIALTAKAMKADRDHCLEVGASDYISKPLDIDQLLSLLRVWLYRQDESL